MSDKERQELIISFICRTLKKEKTPPKKSQIQKTNWGLPEVGAGQNGKDGQKVQLPIIK